MSDTITALTSSKRMAKHVRVDGTIEPYDRAKHFRVETAVLSGIDHLSAFLRWLEQRTGTCLIRGAPRFDCPASDRRRIKADFEDAPRHIIMLDVDGFEPSGDPITDPAHCAREFIMEHLPECFHAASFHWQLSNSAGLPGNERTLKAHLWFWLSTPYDGATLRAWASKATIPVDLAVFDPIQIHYTANPVFEDPNADPIRTRSGFYPAGEGDDENVNLEIDTSDLDIRPHRAGAPGETFAIEDPVWDWMGENWDTFGETGAGALVISCPFEADHSSGQAGDTSTVYFRAGTNGYQQGHFSCLHASCKRANRKGTDFLLAMGYPVFGQLVDISPLDGEAPAAVTGRGIASLPRNRSGGITATWNNISEALGDSDGIGMRLSYDAFLDHILVAADGEEERPLADRDIVEFILRLERLGFNTPSKDTVRDCADATAYKNRMDSGRRWVEGLEWDGVPRVSSFCARYLGVTDTPYSVAVSRYLFTAVAGRLYEPGVKADMVPVLVGPQASGKSSAAAALVPDPRRFFREVSFNEAEADLARRLKGVMIAEVAELSGLRRRDLETIKAVVTRTNDCWVPKYKEFQTSYPRRAVFIGTTNEPEFLADPTGNRRFLPVKVGAIDAPSIHRDRDQLWAEGLNIFKREGVAWAEAQRLAPDAHHDYRVGDTWEERISAWSALQPRSDFTTGEVLAGALGFEAKSIQRKDEMRASNALRHLGWRREKVYRDGRRVNGYRSPAQPVQPPE